MKKWWSNKYYTAGIALPQIGYDNLIYLCLIVSCLVICIIDNKGCRED